MLLNILIAIFILLLVYILLLPITLYIDTKKNLYYIHLKGLAKASLENDVKDIFRIKLRLLFFTFYLYPLRKQTNKNKIKKEQHKQIKKKTKKIDLKKGIQLLKSFKIKKFYLEIDTGNCMLNAKLYPLFVFLNFKLGSFNINFEGRNRMLMSIQNRPIHIIKSFINI